MAEIRFYMRKEPYGWLSNFERASMKVDGLIYPTNEHYYQSQKAIDPQIQEWIRQAPNPHCAMKAGRGLRKHEAKPNWDDLKVGIMYKGLLAKFSQNVRLRDLLLETGDAILHEDSPTDEFWGIAHGGKDMLGLLLMKTRNAIRHFTTCPKCGLPTINPGESTKHCEFCGWEE